MPRTTLAHSFRPRQVLAVILVLLLPAAAVRAAPSLDTCVGYVDSLPATISTQGTWCLRNHLSTAITTGAAITIATNNVVLDCNDFRIGGLAAGDTTLTIGVLAEDRQNVTVRNCGIRGFNSGIDISGSGTAGHLVEDNRLDQNTRNGLRMSGANYVVRRNRNVDTGGRPAAGLTNAIVSFGTDSIIEDNQIAGVTVTATNGYTTGIQLGARTVARGNTVTGLVPKGLGTSVAITANSGTAVIRDNQLLSTPVAFAAINGGNSTSLCSGNLAIGFAAVFEACIDAGGNVAN